MAVFPKNVRVRLSFEFSSKLTMFNTLSSTELGPRWFLVIFDSMNTVDVVTEEIKRRVKLKPEWCIELLVDGIMVDGAEDSAIFRENDNVLVRCFPGPGAGSLRLPQSPTQQAVCHQQTEDSQTRDISMDKTVSDEASEYSYVGVSKKKKKKKSRDRHNVLEEKRQEALSLLHGFVPNEGGSDEVTGHHSQPAEIPESVPQTGCDNVKKKRTKVTSVAAGSAGDRTVVSSGSTPLHHELSSCEPPVMSAVSETMSPTSRVSQCETRDKGDSVSEAVSTLNDSQEVEEETKKKRRRRKRKRKSDKDTSETTSEKPATSSGRPQESFQRRAFPTRRAFSATLEGIGNHIQFDSDGDDNCDNSETKKPKLSGRTPDNIVNGQSDNLKPVDQTQVESENNTSESVVSNTLKSNLDSSINRTLLLLSETELKKSEAHTNVQSNSDLAGCDTRPSRTHDATNLSSGFSASCDIFGLEGGSSSPMVFERSGAALAMRHKSKRQATCLLPPGQLVAVRDSQAAVQDKTSTSECNGKTTGSSSTDADKPTSPPADYSHMDTCSGPPRKGDRIAYKVLELSDDYSPQVSCFKVATVLSYDGSSKQVEMKLDKGQPRKSGVGKFHLEDDEEKSVDMEELMVTLPWSSLIEPKLLTE